MPFVEATGGKMLGSVRAPLGTSDFSSYLIQAKASGAKVIGLANAGTALQNASSRQPGSASPELSGWRRC